MNERPIYSLGLSQQEVYGGSTEGTVPYHRMYGKAYCLPSVAAYTPEEVAELAAASAAMDRIFRKTMQFIQRYMPDSYLIHQLGIAPSLLPLVRKQMPLTGITRQDWILGPGGMKMIENNADTPTGIPESAYLEQAVLHQHTSWNGPSGNLEELLSDELYACAAYYGAAGLGPSVTFSCYDWHPEDRANTLYLMELLRSREIEVHYAPLEELEIEPGKGLYHNGRKIEIWYRLYPLEYLIHDQDEATGVKVGEALIELAAAGRLGIINPPQNFILQSKGFLATLWALYERNHQTPEYCGFTLFSEEDLKLISAYCLPTYFSPEPFQQQGSPYAAKSYWGREGKGTELIGINSEEAGLASSTSGPMTAAAAESAFPPVHPSPDAEEDADILAYYDDQPKIYQQYWPMPAAEVETEEGMYRGRLLTGVFVIGGHFGGLLTRIGGRVTGDGAYYCPAAVVT